MAFALAILIAALWMLESFIPYGPSSHASISAAYTWHVMGLMGREAEHASFLPIVFSATGGFVTNVWHCSWVEIKTMSIVYGLTRGYL